MSGEGSCSEEGLVIDGVGFPRQFFCFFVSLCLMIAWSRVFIFFAIVRICAIPSRQGTQVVIQLF